jgi:hypothetical protein
VLAAAIDIRRWLEADRRTPFADRLARDRAIGRSLRADDESSRVLAWWALVGATTTPGPVPAVGSAADGDAAANAPMDAAAAPPGTGARVERYRRFAVIGLLLFGLLGGAATAAVAFAYDGRHPVNLFRLLGLLVVLPGVLLLLTLALLPLRRRGGAGDSGGMLAALNAGRWAGAVLDRIARIELFAPSTGAPFGLAGFARWQVLVFSQWAALGFFIGAIGYGLLLVAFTDLAFGWSTTLDVAVADAHRAFAALAAPWAGWLPQAAPDYALTEASRYFRGEAPALAAERAARLGAWWPFVFMTVTVYGLLPRVVLLGWAGWRLRGATRTLLLEDPEVAALLDRLAAPVVAPGGDGRGAAPETVGGELAGAEPESAGDAPEALLVIWNRALSDAAARAWLAERLGLRTAALLETGAVAAEQERRAALQALLPAPDGEAPVRRLVVLTRGWEPPLLEFADFLGMLRERAGAAASITVVPIDVGGTRVEAADRAVWAGTLARLRDPRLYVQEALD